MVAGIRQREPQHNQSDPVPAWPGVRAQGEPQHDQSDPVRVLPGSRAQGWEYGERGSVNRRPFRALARFIVAALIGAGLTLAWQSYGDEGVEMATSYAPTLARLLPAPKTKSPHGNQMPAVAVEVKQQLEPIALDLVVVRRAIDQLAANVKQLAADQERMVQNIATMQTIEPDISQKTSSAPMPRAAPLRNRTQPAAQSSATPQPSTVGQPSRLR